MATKYDGPVLDEQTLQSIRELRRPGRADIFAELIQIFLETAITSREKILECARANNLKELSKAAHFLKSGAANLGALRLAETCLDFEKYADGSDVSTDLLQLQKNFEAEYDAATNALKNL